MSTHACLCPLHVNGCSQLISASLSRLRHLLTPSFVEPQQGADVSKKLPSPEEAVLANSGSRAAHCSVLPGIPAGAAHHSTGQRPHRAVHLPGDRHAGLRRRKRVLQNSQPGLAECVTWRVSSSSGVADMRTRMLPSLDAVTRACCELRSRACWDCCWLHASSQTRWLRSPAASPPSS